MPLAVIASLEITDKLQSLPDDAGGWRETATLFCAAAKLRVQRESGANVRFPPKVDTRRCENKRA